ncbi:MAG: GNAT family N-acetyltransferase [Chloroflexi bacterium]|nr:GNAT family N-acetyltransferase [Chloroflexota bacterium]
MHSAVREETRLTMTVIVRDATEADFESLTKLDLTYTVGDRYLELERSGSTPELTYSMRWRTGPARERVYDDTLTVDSLRDTLQNRADAFFVAEVDGAISGYEMIVNQQSHHAAAQITDLAVHRPARRSGAGRALVDAAATWARDRGLRAVWASPRGDASDTIDFYLRVGFRVSGLSDRWNTNDDHKSGQQTIYMYLELG